MKKIKLCIVFLIIIFPSCVLQNVYKEKVMFYKQERIGEITPDYLILKKDQMSYDLYMPGSARGVIGIYEIIEDTLCLIPKFEYFNLAGNNFVHIIEPSEITVNTIPHYFLMKKDSLFNITNYENYVELASFFSSPSFYNFTRLKRL